METNWAASHLFGRRQWPNAHRVLNSCTVQYHTCEETRSHVTSVTWVYVATGIGLIRRRVRIHARTSKQINSKQTTGFLGKKGKFTDKFKSVLFCFLNTWKTMRRRHWIRLWRSGYFLPVSSLLFPLQHRPPFGAPPIIIFLSPSPFHFPYAMGENTGL